MTTLHHRTTCPFCGTHHDRITATREEVAPQDGDASLCFACGEFNIVDSGADEGMRKPTKRERRMLDDDKKVAELREAWRMVKTVRQ